MTVIVKTFKLNAHPEQTLRFEYFRDPNTGQFLLIDGDSKYWLSKVQPFEDLLKDSMIDQLFRLLEREYDILNDSEKKLFLETVVFAVQTHVKTFAQKNNLRGG